MNLRLIVSGVLTIVLIGCGSNARPRTVPVSGKVTVGGKATAGVSLSFHPLDQPDNLVPATAKTRADGTFELSSFAPNDGAPPGAYAVTAVWPKQWTKIGEQEFPVGDRLNGAYARKDRTPLKVTIREGVNQLEPIHLKAR